MSNFYQHRPLLLKLLWGCIKHCVPSVQSVYLSVNDILWLTDQLWSQKSQVTGLKWVHVFTKMGKLGLSPYQNLLPRPELSADFFTAYLWLCYDFHCGGGVAKSSQLSLDSVGGLESTRSRSREVLVSVSCQLVSWTSLVDHWLINTKHVTNMLKWSPSIWAILLVLS